MSEVKIVQQFSKKVIIFFAVFILSACQGRPSVDRSVDYENARSIPSLQVPAPEDKDK